MFLPLHVTRHRYVCADQIKDGKKHPCSLAGGERDLLLERVSNMEGVAYKLSATAEPIRIRVKKPPRDHQHWIQVVTGISTERVLSLADSVYKHHLQPTGDRLDVLKK